MNKKVLTVCAALLLSSSFAFASDYTLATGTPLSDKQQALSTFSDDNIQWVTQGEERVGMNLTGDVTFDDQTKFLVIDQDDFVLEGNHHTWRGPIVITGENVTIKNLNIDYTNSYVYPADGSRLESKSAIAVFASSVNLVNNIINCNPNNQNYMNNAISIFPVVPDGTTPDYNITGNTITGANMINPGDETWPAAPSFGIQIVGDVNAGNDGGFTYFTPAEDSSSPAKSAKIDFSTVDLTGTTFDECATDYAYIEVSGDVPSTGNDVEEYKVVQVEPNATNKVAILKALTHAVEGATVVFDGTESEFNQALAGENLSELNVAVQCNDVNLLFGDAEAPAGSSNPSKVVEFNEDGSIVVDLLEESVKAMASGHYYLFQNTSNGTIAASGFDFADYATLSNADKAAYLWTIDEIVTTADENVAYATLKNKDGNSFLNAPGTDKIVVKLKKVNGAWEIDYSNDHVQFSILGDLNENSVNAPGSNAITVVSAPANQLLTASQLKQYLGASFDIKLSYDNKALEGDKMTGTLTPVTDLNRNTNNGAYALKTANGEYVVVDLTEQYAVGNNNTYGYEVTTMTDKELRTVLADNDNWKKYAYRFSIYAYDDFTIGDQAVARIEVRNDVNDVYTLGALTLKDKKNYLTAEKKGTDYQYAITVQLGHFNTVNIEKLLGTTPAFFSVTNKNTKAKYSNNYGKVLGLSQTGAAAYVDADDALIGYPETQWAITVSDIKNTKGEVYDHTLTFTNRENGDTYSYDASELYYVPGESNVFAVSFNNDTIEIKGNTNYTPADGFKRYNFAELEDQNYYVGVYNAVMDTSIWMVENHNKSHQVGLVADQEDATEWALKPIMRYTKDVDGWIETLTPDTIEIKSNLGYYKNGSYTTTDAQKIPVALKLQAYALRNSANDEYMVYNATKEYYETGKASEKIGYTAINQADFFALKEVGNGRYQLITIDDLRGIDQFGNKFMGSKPLTGATLVGKVYGGHSADMGMTSQTTMYDQTKNDIITIEEKAAPEYRKVAMGNTISIFRNADEQDVLFENGEFLGTATSEQFAKANPALFVDTAYINRPYNNRWEYLLAVDAKHWESNLECNIPGHPKHEADTTTGRFLVNLMDSAYVYHANNIHNNKFINEEDGETFAKLGFVEGYHTHDTLYLKRPNGTYDKIAMNREDYSHSIAKFAFRYVDNDSESFVIETGVKAWNGGEPETPSVVRRGFIKWLNGTLVVVDDIKAAEIFNMNEDETRTPTANESINAEGAVSVTATDGAVIIKGAAGKNVVIATILGKVVANETINSDNETIAVPAGIAVVSVDGESFKVVVK